MTYLKLLRLKAVTSIYGTELSKLPFRVLAGILIKSLKKCIEFFTILQQEGKSFFELVVEISFH